MISQLQNIDMRKAKGLGGTHSDETTQREFPPQRG